MSAELDKLARARAMEKIRKLLAMAERSEGNEAEAAVAAAMAEKLMRHYQVEAGELTVAELERPENFAREVADVLFRDPGQHGTGYVKQCPSWVQFIALGCARAYGCKVDMVGTKDGVKVRFSGYAMDVGLCKWVYKYLCDTVYRLSRTHCAGRGTASGLHFRTGAGQVLQHRLEAIAAEREASAKAAGAPGMALVVVDAKRAAVEREFGPQETEKKKVNAKDHASWSAGAAAGRSIDIQQHRPLGGAATTARLQ